ncbi:MAG: penicillin-binding transpeptidase domain-containing protein, partial [Butyricicoccus sp.]
SREALADFIARYGLAMDLGEITPYSVVTDMPVYVDDAGNPRPRNDSGDYRGQTVVRDAVARSVNAVAMRILQKTSPETVYTFLTETLGFKEVTLADCDLAPLSLGGMTKGVTVREMAGAYTVFLNEGKYSGTRTYTQVFDHDGELLLDNTPEEQQVFQREQTSYYMTEVLSGVTERGTATRAQISGIDTAGKTGTTTSNRDRWFCGYTPYYVGATWFGYDEEYNLTGVSGNPSVTLWTAVMKKLHEDLPSASFDMGDDSLFTRASYCTNTGLKPNGSCPTATGRFYKGDEPTETCNVCTTVTICKDSGKLWQEGLCPEESRETRTMMDLTRYFPIFVSIGDAGSCFTGVNEPVVVSGGSVMVSGGELGICDFEHIPLGGEDPEQVDENGNPIVDPENPEEETGTGMGGILDSLRDLFE